MMEIAFIRPKNIKFDRHLFFLRKQQKGENVERFYSILKELAQNCDFESRETLDPERALSTAATMEMGHQNQQRISSNNNNANGTAINAIQSFNRFRGANARGNQSGRISFN